MTFLCRAREAGPPVTLGIAYPPSAIGHELPDDLLVSRRENFSAAGIADEFGGTLDHSMPLSGLTTLDPAGCGKLEALFRTRFGLHLGHFDFPGIVTGRLGSPYRPDALWKRVHMRQARRKVKLQGRSMQFLPAGTRNTPHQSSRGRRISAPTRSPIEALSASSRWSRPRAIRAPRLMPSKIIAVYSCTALAPARIFASASSVLAIPPTPISGTCPLVSR